jgi:hypothetical protein
VPAQPADTLVLPEGVPAEALVAGEAKAAGKPVAKKKPAPQLRIVAGNSEPPAALDGPLPCCMHVARTCRQRLQNGGNPCDLLQGTAT